MTFQKLAWKFPAQQGHGLATIRAHHRISRLKVSPEPRARVCSGKSHESTKGFVPLFGGVQRRCAPSILTQLCCRAAIALLVIFLGLCASPPGCHRYDPSGSLPARLKLELSFGGRCQEPNFLKGRCAQRALTEQVRAENATDFNG